MIAILLAAVVLIILVVVVLFRVYLRADDLDPFDEVPDEPRRAAKGREPHGARGAASRPAQPAFRGAPPGAAPPVREPAMTAARRPAGRSESGFRGPDRPAAPARRDSAPRPVPAASRAAKSGQATDWEKMSDVDYWSALGAEKPLAESGPQNIPSPSPARRHPPEPAVAARQAANGAVAAAPMASSGGRAQRRGGQDARLQAADAGTGPRPANYHQQPQAGPGSRPADYHRQPPAGPGQHPAEYDDEPDLAGRRRSHSPGWYARGAGEIAAHGIAALARLGNQDRFRHDEPLPPVSSGPPSGPDMSMLPGSQLRPPARHGSRQSADDDPLTSPSFPAITTSDSRSYRATRADSQPTRIPVHAEARPQPGYNAISQPGGYPVQPSAPASNPYGSFVSQPAAGHQPPPEPYSGRGYAPPGANGRHGRGAHAAPDYYSAAPGPYPAPVPTGVDPAGYPAAGYGQPGGYPGGQYDQRDYAGQEPGYGYQDYPRYGTTGY